MKKNILFALSLLSMMLVTGCGNSSSSSSTESTTTTPTTTAPTSTPTTVAPTTSDSIVPEVKDLYASPNGTPFGAGTISDPMLIEIAVNNLTPGSTLYLLEGVYKYNLPIMIDDSTHEFPAYEGHTKTMMPYNNGKVEFDFSGMNWDSANRGIKLHADYWVLKNFEVHHAGDNGIYIGGSYNVIENIVTHNNGDSGIQLGRENSGQNSIDTWPSYNLIKNCTSYDNHDPKGEDSDGFACKLTTGVGNVFDGCIAYNNIDDGWDLYSKGDSGPIGAVTMINCIAFNNGVTSKGLGTSNSDGNGFKLGGETIAVPHKVINCIAYNNLAHGFTDNSNPGTIWMENCTSYNNALRDNDTNNIDMCRNEDTSINYFKNIFSFSDIAKSFVTNSEKNFNSKDQYKGTAVDSIFYYGRTMLKFAGVQACDYTKTNMRGEIYNSDIHPFVSTECPDYTQNIHELLRDENGNISLGDFLKIKQEFVTSAFSSIVALGADLA